MIQTQVAILGGGLAGLNAARLLHRAGVDFHLFEARDRLGGRILTVNEAGQSGDDGFDLGLPSFAQSSEGDVLFERSAQEPAYRYPNPVQGMQSMRLAGGSGALIRALTAGLPVDRLHTEMQAFALTLEHDGARLTLRGTSGESSVSAQRR